MKSAARRPRFGSPFPMDRGVRFRRIAHRVPNGSGSEAVSIPTASSSGSLTRISVAAARTQSVNLAFQVRLCELPVGLCGQFWIGVAQDLLNSGAPDSQLSQLGLQRLDYLFTSCSSTSLLTVFRV
jgi:hypothetical protein